MKTITYTITDELGLHARPAGKLVKLATQFAGTALIGGAGKMADCKRIMGVMGLALKQGDTLTLALEGEGEEAAARRLLDFLQDEL